MIEEDGEGDRRTKGGVIGTSEVEKREQGVWGRG